MSPPPAVESTAAAASSSAATAPLTPHPQGQSPFFSRLPPELRLLIYDHLFSSTRFASGALSFSQTLVPRRHGLAVLRACRRANAEARSRWLGRALFVFTSPYHMLNRLTALPRETVMAIRRVRVHDALSQPSMEAPFGWAVDRVPPPFGAAAALAMIPGLRLDVLTVLGGGGGGGAESLREAWRTLHELVSKGQGWRELRFLSPTSALLGLAREGIHDDYFMPQPLKWRALMVLRDGGLAWRSGSGYRSEEEQEEGEAAGYGSDDGPSVTILRSKCARAGAHHHRSLQDPLGEMEPYFQGWASCKLRENEGQHDLDLTSGDELKKEMLVIVTRGKDADYEVREGKDRTWAEIRHEYSGPDLRFDLDAFDEGDLRLDDEEAMNDGWVEDSYQHVEDYEWNLDDGNGSDGALHWV